MTLVFLIDPVAERRTGTETFLTTGGFRVIASDGSERSPLHRLPGTTAVLVIFDDAHGQAGLALVASRRSEGSDLPVIVAGEHLDPTVAAAILEHGAACLALTAPAEAWYPVLHRLIEQAARTSQLNQKVALLEKKLTLVGSITRHDVLNQLTAVTGYNDLLEMMVTDPKTRSFIEKERCVPGKDPTPVPIFQGLPEYRHRTPLLAEDQIRCSPRQRHH